MNKRRSTSLAHALHWGALEIAGIYFVVGALWILFSDQIAARVALNEEMLAIISLYKGWAYVLITALLLYGLIQRHTARLHASEMQLKRILDALPALISYIDKDQQYRFTNSAYQDWFEGEVVGKHIQEVVGMPAYQSISKYIYRVLGGEVVRYESEVLLPDGERFVSAIYVPDIDVHGRVEGFFALVYDVSKQKQTLEEQRQWADAFEGCAHGIAICDPNTNRVVVCNSAFAKMHKVRVEDIVGSAILSLYAPLEHEHVRHSIEKADQIGHARFETKMIRRGGSIFPVEVDVVSILGEDGEVLHRVVTAQEITERKQAEESLRNSQAQMTGIINSAMDAIISTDAEQRILIFNRAAEAMFRCSQSEAVGQPLERFIPERFREAHRRQVRNFGQTGVTSRAMNGSAVVVGRRSNGDEFPCEASISRIDIAGKKIYTVILRDVSERKRAEEENSSLARFPAENPNPVMRATYEGKIIYANAASQPLLQDWHANVGDDLPADWIERIKDRSRIGSGKTIDVQCGKKTYSIMIVYAPDANDVNIYGGDITERKQVEEALRKSKERYRYLFENNPHPMWVYDRKTLAFLDVNEASTAKYGYSREEFLNMTIVDIRPPEDLGRLMENLAQPRQPLERSEGWRHRLKDGTVIDVEITSHTIEIDGHESALVVAQDVTERKHAEEALRRSEALLLQTGAMAKVGGWELDLVTMTLVWSQETYRIHEIDPSLQPDVEQAINYYAPEARPLIREAVQRAIEEGQPFDMELPLITAKNKRIWVRAIGQAEIRSGKPTRLFGTFQDITERRDAEAYLRRFELLSEHSRDIILFMGNKDGRILEANAAAVQAYGYSRDELLGLTIQDLRASGTQNLTAEQMLQADAHGILFETIHRRKDGTTFPVEVSSQGATIGGVRTLISIIRDITDRKNAEKALLESEARFRSLFEESADAHLLLENSIFSDCNLAAVQMMRAHSKEEILSVHPSKLSPEYQPDGRLSTEKVDEMIRIALENGSNRFEWIHRRKDGTDFPVEVLLTSISTGERQVIHTVWRDITERKQIEQALQAAHDKLEIKVQERTAALSQANALLQALMDNLPDHIYFKDLQSRFIRNSKSQASLLGLNDPSEVVGKTDFDFFPHAARSYAEEQEVMRSGKPIVDLEEWVVWPDGRETWVLTTKLPLRNSEGQTIGIFGISHDITERKRSEQSIRQLNADLEKQTEQLQAANKELEAFSYSVSHDLRAPLRAIDGYTRILVEDYESILDEEGKRVCGVISREARRMGQLIDDLLSFSRLGRKEMYSSKIEMRTLVVSVLNELLKEEDRERIDVHIANLPVAKGDSSLIRQVWVNLLANAIKFSSKKERAVIEVGGKTTKEELIYYLRDNGAGFEMEYANKLFGVFQRLHSESEFSGTGVGLAIVQRIIRRHGGRIWAEGAVEKGATFYFALPRKEKLS